MILTLYSSLTCERIDITPEQFKRLRDPSITEDKIVLLAHELGQDVRLLLGYTEDLKRSHLEMLELDGSCDYSDHL